MVDWIKVEQKNEYVPTLRASHDDIVLSVDESYYLTPDFTPVNSTNRAYDLSVPDNASVVAVRNYLDNYNAVYHKIYGVAPGETTLTITLPNGKVSSSFKVTVK